MGHRAAGPARRGSVRPRYGRIASALTSVLVTAVALLGASGVLPTVGSSGGAGPLALSGYAEPARADGPHPGIDPGMVTPLERAAAERASAAAGGGGPEVVARPTGSEALPADSGTGRRVVFSITQQRVWLVGARDRVRRTYLVSGSLTDNLRPGTYAVYSRSRHAVGIDDSGTMEYMVRFTHGERAAIGFHDIPVKDGRPLQTRAELGTPRSSGCIRQWRPDARALWEFAPEGTPVVVLG